MNSINNFYAHQREAWNNMGKHFLENDHDRGMVVVPTGGGKTTIAAKWLIENFINKDYRVLWISHRVELLEQAKDTFQSFAYLSNKINYYSMDIISAEKDKWSSISPNQVVVFSTEKSAANNLNYIQNMISESKKGVFVVIDECHHSAAPEYQKIIKTLFNYKKKKKIKLLGLTATPQRMNPNETQILWKLYDDSYDINKINSIKNRTNAYKSVVYEVSQAELINRGILSRPIPLTVKTDMNFETDFTEEDYKHLEKYGELGTHILSVVAKSSFRNRKIVEYYKENMDKYGKTIVFAIDIPHCITLKEEFDNQKISCDYVAYGKEDNTSVIEKFKNSTDPTVLISVIKLTEGFDAPNIQTVFITRPTRSEVLLRQMIGRGLRGPAANGTLNCYLVTFVDTWQMFEPISSEYVISPEATTEVTKVQSTQGNLIPIPLELIDIVYKMVSERNAVNINSIHESLPYGWYQWIETTEDGEKENLILLFETQKTEYDKLKRNFEANRPSIPEVIDNNYLDMLMRVYFGDCPDPLPNKPDLFMLLSAIKKGIKINKFTFNEKDKFSPRILAEKYEKVTRDVLVDELKKIFDNDNLCKMTYKDIFQDFYDEVSKEIDKRLFVGSVTPSPESRITLPTDTLRTWPMPSFGYDLNKLAKSLIYKENGQLNRTLFPNGTPPEYDISYTSKVVETYFGVCRYSNSTIKINKILNSPDIPRFVIEFVLYHELLHTDMPYDGHDSAFKTRERNFLPSNEATKDALNFGYNYDNSISYFWYTKANQFLDTFERKYNINACNN